MIDVAFKGDETIIKSNQHVYQWDTGQKIMVSGLGNSSINQVHFSFNGLKTAYPVNVTNSSGTITVNIPNIVLRYGKDVYMYLCIKNTNGTVVTIKTVIIPVIKRNMPENYMYDDNETVAVKLDELQTEIQRSTGVDTDHETRITSLEEAKTNASGTTFETLKKRLDADVNALNNKITDTNTNVNTLKEDLSQIAYTYPDIESGNIDVSDGTPCQNNNYKRTTDFVKVEKLCIKVGSVGTISCYDENYKFLRCITPLVQGKNKIAYLDDDVKFFKMTVGSSDVIKYQFIDYEFPFKYEIVNYTFGTYGGVVNVDEAHLYTFDYPIFNLAINTTKGLAVSLLNDNSKVITTKNNTNGTHFVIPNLSTSAYKLLLGKRKGKDAWWYNFGSEKNQPNICCYGTSITNTSKEGVYANFLKAFCETDNFTIQGISGGRYSGNIKDLILSDTNSYETIILEGCINDWYYNTPIETLRTAVKEISQNVLSRCTNAFVVIDHIGRLYENIDIRAEAVNLSGLHPREYLLEFSKLFNQYGIRTIDAGLESGINEFNDEFYVDQIHHSINGGIVFAKAIYECLKRYNVV